MAGRTSTGSLLSPSARTDNALHSTMIPRGMSHTFQRKTVRKLKHITWPRVALEIATTRSFLSPNNPGSYDGA
jgi:hypothetical protein